MRILLSTTCALLTACSSVSDLPPSILPPAELQTTPGKWWSFWAGLWTGRGTTPAPAGSGWIQHQPGAPMPVAPTDRVEVLFESGLTGGPYPAHGFGWGSFPDDPGAARIIGWRRARLNAAPTSAACGQCADKPARPRIITALQTLDFECAPGA